MYVFQSTLPREERPLYMFVITVHDGFQSTLPREERPDNFRDIPKGKNISIHAPTRGATRASVHGFCSEWNFNPRSHERSDLCNDALLTSVPSNFNPRSHERSDCTPWSKQTISKYFNPRSHERSDLPSINNHYPYDNFNPRSHERSDMSCIRNSSYILYFNPRSHERSDFDFFRLYHSGIISIHAPTRGATQPQTPNLYPLY